MNPIVSVIITTKNEERNIANCLESVLRQTYFCGKIEIIVVDKFLLELGVFIENWKWKKLIMYPILAAGMYTLRF